LSLESFCKNRSTKDGLHRSCRGCKSIQAKRGRERHKDRIAKHNKEYRDNNKEKIASQKHKYYLANKDYIQARINAYIENNHERHNAWGAKSRYKLKLEVFSHYSAGQMKCYNCNETDLCVLSMDHIDGGGNNHRKQTGMGCGYRAYQWLKQNGYPDGFQVLCMNCQFRKRYKEPENPTKSQLQRLNYRKLVKSECLGHYGNICPCGEDDLNVLSLDHINDDGAKHRSEIGMRGYNFYMWIRKNEFPNDPPLQVLCMNCQFRKRNKGGN